MAVNFFVVQFADVELAFRLDRVATIPNADSRSQMMDMPRAPITLPVHIRLESARFRPSLTTQNDFALTTAPRFHLGVLRPILRRNFRRLLALVEQLWSRLFEAIRGLRK